MDIFKYCATRTLGINLATTSCFMRLYPSPVRARWQEIKGRRNPTSLYILLFLYMVLFGISYRWRGFINPYAPRNEDSNLKVWGTVCNRNHFKLSQLESFQGWGKNSEKALWVNCIWLMFGEEGHPKRETEISSGTHLKKQFRLRHPTSTAVTVSRRPALRPSAMAARRLPDLHLSVTDDLALVRHKQFIPGGSNYVA